MVGDAIGITVSFEGIKQDAAAAPHADDTVEPRQRAPRAIAWSRSRRSAPISSDRPMPFGPTDLFWIGVVPCVAAALAMWVCSRLRVRPTAAWSASVACGLVVGMVAQNVRVGWPTALDKLLHPRVAIDWLPWLVLVAAAISALAAYAPRSWQRWLVALACVFAIAAPLRLLGQQRLRHEPLVRSAKSSASSRSGRPPSPPAG